MTYQLTTLKNGLRVASEWLPGVESVAVNVSCGVGARYESLKENGISHLLEHMAFKGTKTRTARDIAESFDAIGGQLNAYTSLEMTVYYAKVLKEHIRLAVDFLADILQNSTFLEEELLREKEVIVQEIGMHLDTPDDLIVDHFDITAFPAQPLGRSILSTAENVQSHTRGDIIAYMQKHYTPTRMVLSFAGNITHEEAVKLAEEYFVMMEQTPAPNCETAAYQGGSAYTEGDFEQLHMIIGLPTIPIHSPDYYALQLYTNILGGGMSSRLFQEVREKRGLAYTVYASASVYNDVGIMSVYAAAAPEKAAELGVVLCEEVAAMSKLVSEAEFMRVKNQHRAELLMMRENPQSVSSWIGRHLLMFGEYRNAATITERMNAVSREDIARLGANIAAGTPTIAALGDTQHMKDYDALRGKLAL
jgi:predicted Zn-dependent peptidase